jgi:hypothetical protein
MATKPNGNGFSPTNGDGGRPSKYRKEYNKIARQMCKIGATDTEIAEALDIDRTTLWDWKRLHTAFANAFVDGREKADERVKRRLYERAVIDGDVGACQWWLKNRQPAAWRDKQEISRAKPLEVIHRIIVDPEPTVIEGECEVIEEPTAPKLEHEARSRRSSRARSR